MAQDKDTINDTISAAIAVLNETYSPAPSLDNCFRKFTTAQVVAAIAELTGQQVTDNAVYETMIDAGFRYVFDETSTNVKYVWLLKYK